MHPPGRIDYASRLLLQRAHALLEACQLAIEHRADADHRVGVRPEPLGVSEEQRKTFERARPDVMVERGNEVREMLNSSAQIRDVRPQTSVSTATKSAERSPDVLHTARLLPECQRAPMPQSCWWPAGSLPAHQARERHTMAVTEPPARSRRPRDECPATADPVATPSRRAAGASRVDGAVQSHVFGMRVALGALESPPASVARGTGREAGTFVKRVIRKSTAGTSSRDGRPRRTSTSR